MILMTTFLMNVLCALVPCRPQFPSPEISSLDPQQQQRSVRGGDRLRQLRNAQIDSSTSSLPLEQLENFVLEQKHDDDLTVNPRVTTVNGEVEGYLMTTVKGRKIKVFEGIPFGEAKRFQPPVPKSAWKHVLQAKTVGPECLQYNPFRGFRVTGLESCLHLNIYTPKLNFKSNEKKLAVIIFIHGGFYHFGGAGEYGPAYLLEKDVVLVTLSYRLGILGFASTGDSLLPGNNGLKDQRLGIKWVHDNIDRFGGSPTQITLMGFSAGGSSTHFHMLNEEGSAKYFQKAISISGTAFNPWALLPVQNVRNATLRMAQSFRCPTTRSKDIVDCLTRQSPAALVARQSALFPKWPYPYVIFGPVIEPRSNHAVIVESPEDSYAAGRVSKIPWIASMTKQEGHFSLLFPYVMGRMGVLRRQWRQIAPDFLVYAEETGNVTGVTDQITKFYFQKNPPLTAPLESFSQAYTDRHFGNALNKALRLHAPVAPTYAYLFDYLSKHNMGNLVGLGSSWAPGHGEDLFYLLNSSSSYTGFKKTDPEFYLSSIMVNLISNFVRGSEPLYTTENFTNVKIWDRIEDKKDELFYLKFDTEVKMVPQPHQSRIALWNSLELTSLIPSKIVVAAKATDYGESGSSHNTIFSY